MSDESAGLIDHAQPNPGSPAPGSGFGGSRGGGLSAGAGYGPGPSSRGASPLSRDDGAVGVAVSTPYRDEGGMPGERIDSWPSSVGGADDLGRGDGRVAVGQALWGGLPQPARR